MGKLGTNEIRQLARQIVLSRPGGIRYSDLVNEVANRSPETPRNTIHGSDWDLSKRFPSEIAKPSRGLFVASNSTSAPEEEVSAPRPSRIQESDFYAPFAEWLQAELDEVTVACALGGASQREKWGTPDVVGVYKPLPWNLVKFDLEIVSAEIKVDPTASIVAFGQAAAYRLFSTKSYLVMPESLPEADLGRLEALAMLYGIGLVLIKPDPVDPRFSIRVRAQRVSPDMFYVNEFADRLRQSNEEVFEKLFA